MPIEFAVTSVACKWCTEKPMITAYRVVCGRLHNSPRHSEITALGCLWPCAVVALDETNDRADFCQIGDRTFTGPGPIRSSQTGTGQELVPRSVHSPCLNVHDVSVDAMAEHTTGWCHYPNRRMIHPQREHGVFWNYRRCTTQCQRRWRRPVQRCLVQRTTQVTTALAVLKPYQPALSQMSARAWPMAAIK